MASTSIVVGILSCIVALLLLKNGWQFVGFPEEFALTVSNIYAKIVLGSQTTQKLQSSSTAPIRLFTTEELAKYSGEKGLYLSILGRVFDVQDGERHYSKGKAYHHFTGKDASRSFVTGDFSESGLRDDVQDLNSKQLLGLKEWLETYYKNYKYVGNLVGRYYMANGMPSEYGIQVQRLIENAIKQKDLEDEQKRLYPPCNTEWRQDVGGRVWCSPLSGGIRRDWEGFPRLRYSTDMGSTQCVCVHPSKLDNPMFKIYPGCVWDSVTCDVVNE